MRIFVSHSTKDRAASEKFVETLRLHYLSWWYAPRSLGPGYFEKQIHEALDECHWFVVLISSKALESEWVRKEVAIAMRKEHLIGKILPVVIEECDWKTIHEKIGRYEKYDFVNDELESWNRLLNDAFHVQPHVNEYYSVGDVKVQVSMFVGGDGVTTFHPGDVICNAPSEIYELPAELAATADVEIAAFESIAKQKGQILFNNRQMRLNNVSWGSERGFEAGIDNRPLRMEMGWTYYYFTKLTNMNTDRIMGNGRSLSQNFDPEIQSLHLSKLSNPFAVNLSVVTADNFIYHGFRGSKVAWNPGTYQPAVSGDGQPEDQDESGIYDPFHTAIREAMEECTGAYRPTPDQVTFFGLARTMKTRFPFLFGELRVPITARKLESRQHLNQYEGTRHKIPFTVEDVCRFVLARYKDQIQGRLTGAIGTTIFSLLQSLHYEYSERWDEVIDRLSFLED